MTNPGQAFYNPRDMSRDARQGFPLARRGAFLAVLFLTAAFVACGGSEAALPTLSPDANPLANPAAASPAAPPAPAFTGTVGEATAAEAANAFLDALTGQQRAAAALAFDDPARANWSNLPAGRFERNGVRIGDLDDGQAGAMRRFLSSALSADGYATVLGVVGAEGVLAQSGRAERFGWSADNYWLAFFGEPSDAGAWAWQFGGHHLAINVTVVGGRSYLSPTFVGVEPASYESGGSTIAPLDAEAGAGLAIVNALDDGQRAAATLAERPAGILTGAGKDGFVPVLQGAKVSGWNAAQRQLLLDAVALWIGLLDESSSRARLAEIRSELDDTRFAWNGDDGGTAYYRIQGPTLIVEFSTQGQLGGDGLHYHSIYRDPTNEYGSRASAPP